jgi:hypothetical protein
MNKDLIESKINIFTKSVLAITRHLPAPDTQISPECAINFYGLPLLKYQDPDGSLFIYSI